MKIFLVIILFNCLSFLHSQELSGDWWRYNSDSLDHDYLFIDEDLNFTLKISSLEANNVFEGDLRIIMSQGHNYYTEVSYKTDVIFGEITYRTWDDSILFRLYISNNYYIGVFYRDIRFPDPPREYDHRIGFFNIDFLPTPGMFGWQFYLLSNAPNERVFSIDIYSLNFVHLYSNTYLNIIPAKYYYNFYSRSHEMSFLNAELFWDVLSLYNRRRAADLDTAIMLGPTVSYNRIFLRNFDSFDFSRYDFRGGLKILLLFNLGLNLETGYINRNGNHGFYFSVVLGNFLPVILPFMFWGDLF